MFTDWESRYKIGDMPWEKGAPSPGLVEYLENNPRPEGRILVPGCGMGHDVRALSSGANEVIGMDIAPSAIEGAGAFPKVGHERFVLGNFFELPAEFCGAFNWVWEHTCFCAIDPSMRVRYAQSVAEALVPGGHYLAIFYLDPDNDDEGPPFGVTDAELDAFFLKDFDLLREWRPSRSYPGREGRELMWLLQKRGAVA